MSIEYLGDVMPKILNFGSLNIDYVYDVPHFVQPGETLMSSGRNIFAGGKGLNQSVALKRAGGDVYHFGAVGSDDASILTDVLNECQIKQNYLKKAEGASGHTIIQVDAHGQNCIILFGGANQTITKEDIDNTLNGFDKGDYLVLQNETNNIEYMIRKANEKGLIVCFNVSPFSEELLSLPLELCSYLIVNEIEGAAMVGMDPENDPYTIIDALSKKFPKTSFVLTLGSRGSMIKQLGCDVISCKTYKVQAVDTTAAGDTFLGYLVSNLAMGENAKTAISRATAASALAVQVKGATPSIPEAKAVYEFIKEKNTDVIVDRL